MTWRWDLTPVGPNWTIDWRAIRERVPGIQELDQCLQDSDWHGEGDVGTHTRMMCASVVSSGLPGSGKNTWIAQHANDQPVVSLDTIRKQHRVRPEDNQGEVIRRGREVARSLLRGGRDFVWNATNTTHQLRAGLVNLFLDYGACVRIVYLEEPLAELIRRNQKRTAPVPRAVLEKLIDKLDVRDSREAHRVDWV